jgi:hypothetical protein
MANIFQKSTKKIFKSILQISMFTRNSDDKISTFYFTLKKGGSSSAPSDETRKRKGEDPKETKIKVNIK